jgi:hypothetical protein
MNRPPLSPIARQQKRLKQKSARARRRRTLAYIEMVRKLRDPTKEELVAREIYLSSIAEDKKRRPENGRQEHLRYRALKGKS